MECARGPVVQFLLCVSKPTVSSGRFSTPTMALLLVTLGVLDFFINCLEKNSSVTTQDPTKCQQRMLDPSNNNGQQIICVGNG